MTAPDDPTLDTPIVLVQNAGASPQVSAPYTPRANVQSRTTSVQGAFDFTLLPNACRDLSMLSNASHSTGCSPVLKELLYESGLLYQVNREIWPDSSFHATGDAIDVSSEHPLSLTQFLALIPEMFSQVIYYDPDYDVDCLYIQNGQLTSGSSLSGIETGSPYIHIASTLGRMHTQLLSRSTQAILNQWARRLVYDPLTSTGGGLSDDAKVGFW